MPIHDWSRVYPGIFHDFHNAWMIEFRKALNEGGLPSDYYAITEQHAGKYITDVLTLRDKDRPRDKASSVPKGGVAVVEVPPQVRRQLSLCASARAHRKTVAIRHISGDRLVAMIELVSPANKDREEHINEFVDKMEDALAHGIHLLVLDLFAPGKHDPNGIHGAIWDRLGDTPESPSKDEPFTLAAYVADSPVKAYLENVGVGGILPEMPLFLDPDYYVRIPLEATYLGAWSSTPQRWREVLEK